MSKDCPPEVLNLVERFERELDSYRSGKYNETQARREFIDPMFRALGSAARILYMNFREYSTRWEEIASVFSRDAILKGSFDRFADSSKRKRGTAEVDAAFLAEIESWRDSLARHMALRNPTLTQRELNFAVQQTIDRKSTTGCWDVAPDAESPSPRR